MSLPPDSLVLNSTKPEKICLIEITEAFKGIDLSPLTELKELRLTLPIVENTPDVGRPLVAVISLLSTLISKPVGKVSIETLVLFFDMDYVEVLNTIEPEEWTSLDDTLHQLIEAGVRTVNAWTLDMDMEVLTTRFVADVSQGLPRSLATGTLHIDVVGRKIDRPLL